MPRIGVLLVRAGVVREESVNRALAVQGFAGGRLGTLLLERGSVTEDDVGNALAEQHGCEYVPWRVLGAVSSNVIAALPPKFAIRHTAVPVDLGDKMLRVALRDPSNLRILDELFFVTGKKILPAVAPEVRLYQALEKYYGERRTPRFAILAEKLSRPTLSPVIRKKLPPPPDFSAPSPGLPDLSGRAGEPEQEPFPIDPSRIPDAPPVGWGNVPAPEPTEGEPDSIAWEEVPPQPPWSARHEPPPPAPASGAAGSPPASRTPPAAKSAPLSPVGGDFHEVRSARARDEVFDAALRLLQRRFRKAAIFAVRPENVVGWAGAGERVDTARLRALDFSWGEPSLFLNVRMSRSFYLGPLPPLPRHRELADALGGWPVECLVQPVIIRDRAVAFLYAECGTATGATPADLAYARELAAAASAALVESIRLRKQQAI
jgi:hypothetical protein